MSDLLTPREQVVIGDLGRLAVRMSALFGSDVPGDWLEAVHYIHALQNMIMAQAAARSYPGEYRLLGHRLKGEK